MTKKKVVEEVLHLVPINLETSIQYATHCIYIISNDRSKTCLIGSSSNLYTTIGRLLEDLKLSNGQYKSLKDDLENVTISILETNLEKGLLKLRQAHWIRTYRDKRYKFYKDISPLKYTLSIDLGFINHKLYYFVSLTNQSNDSRLIGRFSTKKEMNDWIGVSYPDLERISSIVIHESVRG